MKKLMELGDNYAKASTWKDFALVKFCLFSMGLFFGTLVAEENKKTVIVMSIIVVSPVTRQKHREYNALSPIYGTISANKNVGILEKPCT